MLIELLIVIGVGCGLAALFLPAILKARDAAQRFNCQNNLKRLGLATQNYHATQTTFPLGGYPQPALLSGARVPAAGVSFYYGLLPFLDQAELFNTLVSDGQAGGNYLLGPNAGALNGALIQTLLCPTSPLSIQSVGQVKVMFPSYMGVAGAATTGPLEDTFPETRNQDFSTECGGQRGQISWGGVLFPNQVVTSRDVRDGLANVLLLVECSDAIRASDSTVGARIDGGFPMGWLCSTDSSGTQANYKNASTGQPNRCSNITTIMHPVGYRVWPPKTSPTCLFNFPNSPILSAHPEGASILFCDGSVRYVSTSMNLTVLKQLATRDDGAPMGEF